MESTERRRFVTIATGNLTMILVSVQLLVLAAVWMSRSPTVACTALVAVALMAWRLFVSGVFLEGPIVRVVNVFSSRTIQRSEIVRVSSKRTFPGSRNSSAAQC